MDEEENEKIEKSKEEPEGLAINNLSPETSNKGLFSFNFFETLFYRDGLKQSGGNFSKETYKK